LDIDELKGVLRRFADERDWDQFHSPKNLSMALSVEAAELLEHFQWLTEEQSGQLPNDAKSRVAEEIADIQIYLVRLADKLGIDIDSAVQAKLEVNRRKYPADLVRGSSAKYTAYRREPTDDRRS
jgi:NTP pyrophosphatase (non-canonical NTP hydrolase)